MTAPLPPVLVTYDIEDKSADERKARIKRGDAPQTYSFTVATIKEKDDERHAMATD